MYTLYDYFRSTASYRVRVVLELKNIPYQRHEIHLVKHGGEQHGSDYSELNPQQLVPALAGNNLPQVLNQSLAIIDYLESQYPKPTIYADDIILKTKIKAIALQICSDIHPLNNLRVLKYLKNELNISETQKIKWYHNWLEKGFTALEQQLVAIDRTEGFCIADRITLADVCLIPQIYNANRFEFNMKPYPLLNEINICCLELAPFKNAAP